MRIRPIYKKLKQHLGELSVLSAVALELDFKKLTTDLALKKDEVQELRLYAPSIKQCLINETKEAERESKLNSIKDKLLLAGFNDAESTEAAITILSIMTGQSNGVHSS